MLTDESLIVLSVVLIGLIVDALDALPGLDKLFAEMRLRAWCAGRRVVWVARGEHDEEHEVDGRSVLCRARSERWRQSGGRADARCRAMADIGIRRPYRCFFFTDDAQMFASARS